MVWLVLLKFYKTNAKDIFGSEAHDKMREIFPPESDAVEDKHKLIRSFAEVGQKMSNDAIFTILPFLPILEASNSAESKDRIGNELKATFGNCEGNIFYETISLSIKGAKLAMALCVSDMPLIDKHRANWRKTMKDAVLPSSKSN